MGLDNSIELALTNLDLNKPVQTSAKAGHFWWWWSSWGASSTLAYADLGLDIENEDGGEDNGRMTTDELWDSSNYCSSIYPNLVFAIDIPTDSISESVLL